MKPFISFTAFHLLYADRMGWRVPDFQIAACAFLEDYGALGLLMLPRGHGKSSLLDEYNAWRLTCNPQHMILHQGATDPDAYKVSRGTEQILKTHPVCVARNIKKERGETQRWWITGSLDVRHGSIHARGIMSNVTGSRANEIQNDDIEVPGNIGTSEAREKLRYRLSEQTHILIPGGQELYIGTPHTFDSLYTDIENLGAKTLKMKMFEDEARFEKEDQSIFYVDFEPINLFVGIGRYSKCLKKDTDYTLKKTGSAWQITLDKSVTLLDVYGKALWPERFTPEEMEKRRKKCRTLNEWDSQYQLKAKPITDVRLDPDKLIAYDVEPVIRTANGETIMMLGNVRIVSGNLRWDPSSGKAKSDVSSLALVFQDDMGRLYWHRSIALFGDIAVFDDDGNIKGGGQVWQICDIIEQYQLTRVTIETNGVGTHNPTILKAALKKRKIRCGVSEIHSSTAKNKRILSNIEPPLKSGYLWTHMSVLVDEKDPEKDSVQVQQMRQFNPATNDQDDDYIDSLAGAIADEPIRIGKKSTQVDTESIDNWRENSGVADAELAYDD